MIASSCIHLEDETDSHGNLVCEMNPAGWIDDESCYGCSEYEEKEEEDK
jgi:hypothetical protein